MQERPRPKANTSVRTQLIASWNSEADASMIRNFKSRLALGGLSYKAWLAANIAEYLGEKALK